MSWGDPVRNGLSVGIGTLASLTSSSGIGGIRRPTMSLNFLLMSATSLDSRITFSRGTNATLTDSTGRITYAPANLLLQSDTYSNAVFTVSAGVTFSGSTATFTSTGYRYQPVTIGSSIAGRTFIASVVLSSATKTNIVLRMCGNTTSSDQVTSLVTLTPTPTRYSVVRTFTSSDTIIDVGLDNRTVIGGSGIAGDVVVTGFQVEPVTYQTTPSTYVATTSAAYYGPRFDYDPVTLAARGLLIEEQRTNLLTYSQDWTNAAWSKTNLTVTAAATASPDGTVNAQRLQATTTASTNNSTAGIAATATSASFSVYVKQGSSATAANSFALRNNTTATNLVLGTLNYSTGAWTYTTGSTGVTVTNAGNGWWRLQISASSGITAGDLLIGYVGFLGASATAGDFLYAWGAQLEAGAFATSYIPTVASTVTRNADVATMTGTNFSSWYNANEGALAIEMSLNALSTATSQTAAAILTDNNNIIVVRANNTTGSRSATVSTAGVGQGFMDIAGTAANAVQKLGYAYRTNDTAFVVNGGTASTDNTVTLPAVNQLNIGSQSSGAFTNGHIRSIAYYNTRLSNSQLQTLTAPLLAPTLNLDFTNNVYNVGF